MTTDIEHFRNLVSLSAADGKIEEAERVECARVYNWLKVADSSIALCSSLALNSIVDQSLKVNSVFDP